MKKKLILWIVCLAIVGISKLGFTCEEQQFAENSCSELCFGDNTASMAISYKQMNAIFDDIIEGDKCSFLRGAGYRKIMDGGVLADYYRATGVFFHKKPICFLEITRKLKIPIDEIIRMVSVFPLEYTDDLPGLRLAIEIRVNLICKLAFTYKDYDSLLAEMKSLLTERLASIDAILGEAPKIK